MNINIHIDLKMLSNNLSERLCFFASSLRGLLSDAQHPVRAGRDTLLDSPLGAIPSLSQVMVGTQYGHPFEYGKAGRGANKYQKVKLK